MSLVIEIDFTRRKVVRSKDREGNWYRLEGECKQCGKCCGLPGFARHCEYMIKENGLYKCKLHETPRKPFICVMYPYNPKQWLHKDCGYKWVRE